MTGIKQRDELQSTIWKIANEVRGAVDGWDFKQFVLGTLFYRFISENFTSYIEGGDDSIHYADMSDDVITTEIKDDAIKTKGYFIYPSQLFVNIAKSAYTNPNLNTDLAAIFDAIEGSANGYPSEHDIKGLFADFDTTSNRLGNTVEEKNKRLAAPKTVDPDAVTSNGNLTMVNEYLAENSSEALGIDGVTPTPAASDGSTDNADSACEDTSSDEDNDTSGSGGEEGAMDGE